jgi:hypothetical protein
MRKISFPTRNHKHSNRLCATDLAGANEPTAEMTAVGDVVTETGALNADAMHRLRTWRADLKRRLASFKPNAKQKRKER